MSEVRRAWTPEQIDEVRRLVNERLAAAAKPAVGEAPSATMPSLGETLKSAAVVSRFRLQEMESLASSDGEIQQLRAESTPLQDDWHTIPPNIRNSVLEQVSDYELRTLVDANARKDDPVQSAINAALGGLQSNQLPELPREELSALNLLHAGLSRIGPSFPPKEAISRELELARLLAPFKVLTQGFRGRETELEALRNYVGVLPPGSLRGAVARAFSFFNEKKLPFLIFGVGGAGKSTLVARFILEHAMVGSEQQFPFAYLDFDRPVVMAEEPLSIIPETIRQIGLQYKIAHEAAESLSKRLQRRVGAGSGHSQEKAFVSDLVSFLQTLNVREGPILLVLDTLEEVQLRSTAQARAIVNFVQRLTDRLPRLRVVMAGRADIPDLAFDGRLALTGFDADSAVAYLEERGISHADALTIFRQLGGSPLTLRLAAEVMAHGESVDIFTRVRESVVQGQLFDRILLHIENVDVRKLAYLGVVLRRITPDVIARVLAEPCGVDITDAARAEELFVAFGKQLTLVVQERQGVLTPRQDMRSTMLPFLRENVPRKVEEIHRRAVEYYATRNDVPARAEEIYHRLSLRQTRQEVVPRMLPGVETYLANAIDDLAPAEQAILADMLGLELPPEASAAADQETWERNTSRAVAEALKTGERRRVAKLLKQRKERSGTTDLRVQEVRYLLDEGRERQALKAAAEGIAEYDRAGNRPALIAMLLLVASVHVQHAEFSEATKLVSRAEAIAKDHEPILLLRVLRDRVVLLRAQEEDVPKELLQMLTDTIALVSDDELTADPALFRNVAVAVKADTRLLQRAVRLGAIPLRQSDLDQIRNLLDEFDVPVPQPLAEAIPDLLTDDAAGIRIGRMLRSILEGVMADRFESVGRVNPPTSRQLDPSRLHRLHDLLVRLFTPSRLANLVESQLNRSLESLSFAATLSEQVSDLIRAATAEDWIENLIVAVIRSSFDDDDMQSFARSVGMGIELVVQSRDNEQTAGLLRLLEHSGRLGILEARTCTIEMGNEIRGCGVLMPEYFVITAASVVDVPRRRALRLRFDRVLRNESEISSGYVVSTTVVHQDKHGFALLSLNNNRVPQSIGDQGNARGFLELTDRRTALRYGDLAWLWRSRRGTFFDGFIGFEPGEPQRDGTISVPVEASPRQAGCACIDHNLNVVALHYGRDPNKANASVIMPLGTIISSLLDSSFKSLLYEGYGN